MPILKLPNFVILLTLTAYMQQDVKNL